MSPKKPKHIFIVEDDEIYSMMLDYILSMDSVYQFVRFNSGEECIRNLYLNPDIIILDYGLPGMNGYETLLEIKKQKPNIHVIILSSSADSKLVVKLFEAGADDYVIKQGKIGKHIVEKIETILEEDALEKNSYLKKKNKSYLGIFCFIVIVIALSLRFFYLK